MSLEDSVTNTTKDETLTKEQKLKHRREQLAAWRLKKEQEKKDEEKTEAVNENSPPVKDEGLSDAVKLLRQKRIEEWKRKREQAEVKVESGTNSSIKPVSVKSHKIGLPVLKKVIKRKTAFDDESEDEEESVPKFKRPNLSTSNNEDDEDIDLDEYVNLLVGSNAPQKVDEFEPVLSDSDEDIEDEEVTKQNILSAKLKKLQTEKELEQIDHSKIEYNSFNKVFYQEPSDLSKLSEEEVNLIRLELDNIKVKGTCPNPILNWSQLGLPSNYMQVIEEDLRYTSPSAIQSQALPTIMSGRDMIGIAKTGSGKTVAFVLPMLRHILDQPFVQQGEGPIGLIMTPTRELALQIHREILHFTKTLPHIRAVCCYGGSSIEPQIAALKKGAEIIVGTPGRVIDLLSANGGRVTNLLRTTYIVLDEADRMLDMGFEPQVTKIFTQVRPNKQTILFSATFPKKMEYLAQNFLNDPVEITVGGISVVAAEVDQKVEIFNIKDGEEEKLKKDKFERLMEVLKEYNYAETKILIFVEKQTSADNLLVKLVKRKIASLAIHGGKDQLDRKYAIKEFSNKTSGFNILIATSIAARGLDVKGLTLVINFDAASHMEDYVHRVGRTGRAGMKGTAITFVGSNQGRAINDLVKAMKMSKLEIPKDLAELYGRFMTKVKSGEEKASFGFGGKGLEKLDEIRGANKNLEKQAFGGDNIEVSVTLAKSKEIESSLPAFEVIKGRAPETSGPDKGKFHSRVVINDLPQTARWSIVNNESLHKIIEATQTSITNKGQFYPPNAKVSEDKPKLYLLIEGLTEAAVREANNLIRDRMIFGLEVASKETKMHPTTKYSV